MKGKKCVWIPEELHRKIKLLAANDGITLYAIIEKAIEISLKNKLTKKN